VGAPTAGDALSFLFFPNYADDVGCVDGHTGKSSVEFDAEKMLKFMAEMEKVDGSDSGQIEWTANTRKMTEDFLKGG
jgi:hypothetical protein